MQLVVLEQRQRFRPFLSFLLLGDLEAKLQLSLLNFQGLEARFELRPRGQRLDLPNCCPQTFIWYLLLESQLRPSDHWEYPSPYTWLLWSLKHQSWLYKVGRSLKFSYPRDAWPIHRGTICEGNALDYTQGSKFRMELRIQRSISCTALLIRGGTTSFFWAMLSCWLILTCQRQPCCFQLQESSWPSPLPAEYLRLALNERRFDRSGQISRNDRRKSYLHICLI